MRRTASTLVLSAAALLCAAPPQLEKVRSSIPARMQEQNVASIAVAVVRNGEIVWEEAFGWADRENRVRATEHTMYSLASISKPFTATGLMVLRKQGKIDLDRPVNDYLGDVKLRARAGNAAEATVRRVANHTSGLPVHFHFFYSDEPYPAPPRDETIRRYGNLVTVPGEHYQYSNLGYGILDYAIARVSGTRYPDFMREHVFLPLGLTHTAVGVPPRLESYQAVRYTRDGTPIPFYDFDHPGGSAVYSSAHDLVRFGMFHLKAHLRDQKAILGDEEIDQMHEPSVKSGPDSGYGIGWGTQETAAGYRIVSHTGSMGGVNTVLSLIPAKKIAIVVLANSSTPLPYRLCDEIAMTLVPDLGLKRVEPREKPPEPFRPGAELAGTWKGAVHTYKAEIPLRLSVQESGDVHGQLGTQLETVVSNPRFDNGFFTGRLNGDIGTEDANRRPYVLEFSLQPEGHVLHGVLSAMPTGSGPKLGNGLSHWVELRRD